MKSFVNKVAAITGAGSGIGRALAIELASRNCDLALADIDVNGLKETVALVESHGVKVTETSLDTSSRQSVYDWADQVVRDHSRVNFIFNNAGVALSASAEKTTQEDFEWLMNINFWGVVWGTQAFLPYLKESGEGHVVNISSLFGLLSMPLNSAYNASKYGVRGFTECLRMELEIERAVVSATCVHPGGVRTSIARDARTHESSEDVTGLAAADDISEFDKLLNTTMADSAARQIVRAVEKNKRRVLVGIDAKIADSLVRLIGSSYQWFVVVFLRRRRRRALKKLEAGDY